MERIENQMVIHRETEDNLEKVLEICANCKCEMKHGNKFHRVWNVFFCEDCVETGELDESDY